MSFMLVCPKIVQKHSPKNANLKTLIDLGLDESGVPACEIIV